ncbi:hypothetical protein EPN44_11860 [bacterium]|nr:MAG: hypothetical protein EPN44_11860 [bacterium]
MIANGINVILGISLVYVAVLDTPLFAGPSWRGIAALAALCFVAFAFTARRSDYAPWHAILTSWLGALLVAAVGLSFIPAWPVAASTWICFWAGLLTAFLALWAALYRRSAARYREQLAGNGAAATEST